MGMEWLAMMIPILALSIPIVAILSSARLKRMRLEAQQSPGQREYVAHLERRVASLEETVAQLSGNVDRLEDKHEFLSRLLEDKR